MKEMTGDPREYEAFVREIDESQYVTQRENMPRGIIPKRRGMSLAKSLAMEGVFTFPNFSPRLIASLVASSTAECTSGVVTVTATSHLITATTFDGWNFYYPGSPSLSAGWYAGFTRVDANSVTFVAPFSANFTSESVNGGAAFVDEVTFESMTLPAKALQVGSMLDVQVYRSSNNTAGTKTIRQKIGSSVLSSHANTSTTTLHGVVIFGGVVTSPAAILGSGYSGSSVSAQNSVTINAGSDQVISVTGQLSAAGMFLALVVPSVRIS